MMTLNNGVEIPQIGLGLWQNKNERECHDAVISAIASGYRHFDSAQIYDNEHFLGSALSNAYSSHEVSREDIFITTKLWNDNQFFDDVIPSFEDSLEKLQTDYVDMFLIHFPVTETRRPAWRRMEEIYTSGKAKSIGVSNYTIKHLQELLDECDIKPVVNQVEIHVYLQQQELRDFCAEHDIAVEAYSPLAHGHGLDNPTLSKIGDRYGKSSAQIMIKWCAQNNMIVLPKSISHQRITDNINIYDFELDEQDLQDIASLESDLRTCWDPTNVS